MKLFLNICSVDSEYNGTTLHHKINVTSMKKYLFIIGIVSLLTNSVVAQSKQKESKYG